MKQAGKAKQKAVNIISLAANPISIINYSLQDEHRTWRSPNIPWWRFSFQLQSRANQPHTPPGFLPLPWLANQASSMQLLQRATDTRPTAKEHPCHHPAVPHSEAALNALQSQLSSRKTEKNQTTQTPTGSRELGAWGYRQPSSKPEIARRQQTPNWGASSYPRDCFHLSRSKPGI